MPPTTATTPARPRRLASRTGRWRLAGALLLASLAGCSTLRESYAHLKPGMSAEEVVSLVGEPQDMDSMHVFWLYLPVGGSRDEPLFELQLTPAPDQVLLFIGPWHEPVGEERELY